MRKVEIILGLLLISFAILGGVIFYLETFELFEGILSTKETSYIWEHGYGEGGGASNSPVFLGLCGIAGAILLSSIEQKTEPLAKQEEHENDEDKYTEDEQID